MSAISEVDKILQVQWNIFIKNGLSHQLDLKIGEERRKCGVGITDDDDESSWISFLVGSRPIHLWGLRFNVLCVICCFQRCNSMNQSWFGKWGQNGIKS